MSKESKRWDTPVNTRDIQIGQNDWEKCISIKENLRIER